MAIIEYKCPDCGGRLEFDSATQALKCPYCEGTFQISDLEADGAESAQDHAWETAKDSTDESFQAESAAGGSGGSGGSENSEVSGEEWQADPSKNVEGLTSFICPSCGGEILGDSTMAATHCPYCDSPAIVPNQLQGTFAPDLVIPFKTTKEDAKAAFERNCQKRALLPKGFASDQRLDEIVGLYVPFWLYDVDATGNAVFDATTETTQSSGAQTVKLVRHYDVRRVGDASFAKIPADGSKQMDDTQMESIEPFDFSETRPFQKAFLSGFVANRYDVESSALKQRIQQRVQTSVLELLSNTVTGYDAVSCSRCNTKINFKNTQYALLPVWTLASNYNGEVYHFTMNGQTGKFTGKLPVSTGKSVLLGAGVFAGAFAVFCLLCGFFLSLDPMSLLFAAIIAAVVALLVVSSVRKSMDTFVQKYDGTDYVEGSGISLTMKSDTFSREERVVVNNGGQVAAAAALGGVAVAGAAGMAGQKIAASKKQSPEAATASTAASASAATTANTAAQSVLTSKAANASNASKAAQAQAFKAAQSTPNRPTQAAPKPVQTPKPAQAAPKPAQAAPKPVQAPKPAQAAPKPAQKSTFGATPTIRNTSQGAGQHSSMPKSVPNRPTTSRPGQGGPSGRPGGASGGFGGGKPGGSGGGRPGGNSLNGKPGGGSNSNRGR